MIERDIAAGPRVGAVVLAAGRGQRFDAQAGKLLSVFRGQPLILAAVRAAIESGAAPVIVVTGHRRRDLERVLEGLPVVLVANPDYRSGLSSSIRVGLSAQPLSVEGVVMLLGDMPLVTAAHVDRLIAAFAERNSPSICVPTFSGRRGNPVLWDRAFFPALSSLHGDLGGSTLFGENRDAVCLVPMPDDAVLIDVDDADTLGRLDGEPLPPQ
ncbi:MAG: nucleotidyltransferase family protein [Rhodospirillales bacterium]|nr:nucleotidyltransferase family protein [Rhodospirillales bacterium]